jgi:serine carboxypeptidase 1
MAKLALTVVACLLAATLTSTESKPTGEKRQPALTGVGPTLNGAGTEAWGYIDVRQGAHMFYWLYHTYHVDGYLNRPLIIWLQGGPGASSCGYGNFEIIGPLDLDLKERNTTWVNAANVLFIDNPVGSGYSYVDDLTLLTTDVQQITDDLMTLLATFMTYFPAFKTIPIYVFGQSYGGKMGAHFAKQLYDEIQAGTMEATVAGFAMGNSWISPVDSTMTWGPLLYQMSLVDDQGYDAIQRSAELCQRAVEEERWEDATDLWSTTEGVVIYRTHWVDFYNILKFTIPTGAGQSRSSRIEGISRQHRPATRATDPLDDLMNGVIKEQLGIIPDDVVWGAQSDAVFDYQTGDFMKPVVSVVDDALANTTLHVIVYQGQLDLICDTVGTMDWVQKLSWGNLNDYNTADRQWFVNEATVQTEMYVKAYERFKFYWVLAAGHAVPKDNGETALRMLNRILDNLDT